MTTANPLTLVMLVTIFVGTTAALLAWRERPEPGAASLTALLAGQAWWSVFFVLELQATTFAGKVLWSNVQWVGVVVIPIAWFTFSMSYTGRDEYTSRRYLAALSVIPAITVLLAMTTDYHSLLYVESTLVEKGNLVVLHRTGGNWFWLITGYTYLLGLLGSLPLLGLVQSDALPFRGQSVALLLGTLAPWLSNVLFLVDVVPIPGLDPTPVSFAISGVAYLSALTRFRLLGTSPSPNRRARRLVFERMHERAIVVDSHDHVVDMNESAAETFGIPPQAILGSPAREVIPRYETLPVDGPVSGHVTLPDNGNGRPYDVSVTQITDTQGRGVGRVITFHDISEHLRQQQRLEVLNRVLRHNIRTETNLISGYADLMGTDGEENKSVDIVKARAMAIDEMGEKARTIVDIFERGRGRSKPVRVERLLETAISSVRDEYPSVTIHSGPVPDALVDNVLSPVFSNILENAAEHNTSDTPKVWIDCEMDGDQLRVLVADNGPGIDQYERSVLECGTETPLKHGSGLGLWLIMWGAELADGHVEFAENDPEGSVVIVEVPTLSSKPA